MGSSVRFPKIHTDSLAKLIVTLQGRPQSLSLGINPIDNAQSCVPHNNVEGDHVFDECTLSNELSVCTKHLSILWLLEQVCSQTTKYQVSQYEPSTTIARQYENIHWIVLRLTPTPPSWRCDHPHTVCRLCLIAWRSCAWPSMSLDQAIVFTWYFTRGLQVGVLSNFVQEEPHHLQLWPWLGAFVSWTTFPYIWTLTLEFSAILEHPPLSPGVNEYCICCLFCASW